MMYLSARGRLILEQLLINQLPISVKKISKELNVSERTIRRDMKEVEGTVIAYNLKIHKEQGKVSLIGTEKEKQKFRWHFMDLSYNEYSPEERQQKILKALLKEEGLKLVGLANDLNVTVSTISNDLTKIEEWLPETIKIERKRGAGVFLKGTEIQKRNLMSEIFGQQFPNYQLLKFFQEKSREEMTSEWMEERLMNLVDENLLRRVEHKLRKWREETNDISDEAYLNLVIHIAIAVERILEGNFVKTYPTEEPIETYSEFLLAKNLLADILEMDEVVVPKGEAAYVTLYLRGIKPRTAEDTFIENEDIQVVILANKMITQVEKKLGQELPKNQLLKGLVSHLKPTLRRLKQGMRIYNPLIQSIKTDYPELFVLIRSVFDNVYKGPKAPDEEIGYLVLHFGSVILQKESENEFSGLVVCASGIGTSRMLVTKLHQRIPQLKKLNTVSLFELPRKIAENNVDIIISTIDLGKVDFNYFLVSPILAEQELAQIEMFLRNKGKNYQRAIPKEEEKSQLTLLEARNFLEEQQIYTNIVLDILKSFKYGRLAEQIGTIEDIIRAISTQLLEKDVEIEVELLVNVLLRDEKWSGFGIPDTKIGMFHARDKSIKQPFFQLFTLDQSILIKSMDDSNIFVDKLVLLLAPEKFSQQGLEVLSYISAMFVDNETLFELLQYGSVDEVSTYFVQQLLLYLEDRRK